MQGPRCEPNSILSCKGTSASLQPALCWHVHSNTGKGALVWRVICWPGLLGNRSRNCWLKLSVTYSTAHLWSPNPPCYSPIVFFSFGNCLFFFSHNPPKRTRGAESLCIFTPICSQTGEFKVRILLLWDHHFINLSCWEVKKRTSRPSCICIP